MKQHNWSYSTFSIVLLVVCLIAVNVVGNFIPLRLDITSDSLYTVSDGTKEILSDLDDTITIKYYFSKNSEGLPTQFKAYGTRIQELLDEYESLANGHIKLETFDPKPDTEEEEWARKYGVSEVALPSGENFYMGMVALFLDQEVSIPFFDGRREQFLEYDISQAILGLKTAEPPKVGILSSMNLQGGRNPRNPQQQAPPWTLVSELKKNFAVESLQLTVQEIPDDISLLMVIHPKNMSASARYAIDQYVLRGGRLVVMVDPNSFFEAQNSPSPQYGQPPPPTNSDLPELLKTWGVEFSSDKLVGDFKYATGINTGQGKALRYPLWMTFTSEALDPENPVTSQLESLLFIDAGSLAKAEGSTVEFTPVIQTTADSGYVDTAILAITPPEKVVRDLKTDQQPKVLAAVLKDTFKTAFPDGQPTPEGEGATKETLKHEHLSEAKESNRIMVVGDIDFITDSFSVQKMNFLGQTVVQPMNDNLSFVLNTVEFMSGNDALMSIRSRGRFSRPFTRLQALEQQAQMQFQEKEAALQQTLQEVQEKLSNLEQEKDPNKKQRLLTLEQQQEIKNFRAEEAETRRGLREVRKELRQDIEALGNQLLGLNILLIPFLVALAGIFSYNRRTRSRKNA